MTSCDSAYTISICSQNPRTRNKHYVGGHVYVINYLSMQTQRQQYIIA